MSDNTEEDVKEGGWDLPEACLASTQESAEPPRIFLRGGGVWVRLSLGGWLRACVGGYQPTPPPPSPLVNNDTHQSRKYLINNPQ